LSTHTAPALLGEAVFFSILGRYSDRLDMALHSLNPIPTAALQIWIAEYEFSTEALSQVWDSKSALS
jgi:hypothetical protein